jgi:hypothetical protein
VTDWRQEVRPAVLEDLETLRVKALTEAEARLARRGRFPSFAVVMSRGGALRVAESPNQDAASNAWPVDVASDVAVIGVKATRGHAKTYLVVDAEHRDGPRVMTIIDYKRRGWFKRGVALGDSHESLSERNVWLADAS